METLYTVDDFISKFKEKLENNRSLLSFATKNAIDNNSNKFDILKMIRDNAMDNYDAVCELMGKELIDELFSYMQTGMFAVNCFKAIEIPIKDFPTKVLTKPILRFFTDMESARLYYNAMIAQKEYCYIFLSSVLSKYEVNTTTF